MSRLVRFLGMRESEYLDVAAACEYLGVKRAMFYRLLSRHPIPKYRRPVNGRKLLYKRTDLDGLREPKET